MANVYDDPMGGGYATSPDAIRKAMQLYSGGVPQVEAPIVPAMQAAPAAPEPAETPVAAPPAALIPQPVPVAPRPAAAAPQPPQVPAQPSSPALDQYADILAQKPAQPAPEADPMTLGNFRQQAMKAIGESSKQQAQYARETADRLDRASMDADVAAEMHRMDTEAVDEAHRQLEAEWKPQRERLQADFQLLNDRAARINVGDRRSVAQKAAGALAMGLGQAVDQNNLVAGLMQGTPVYTHNADSITANINAAIDRDIDAQRTNLANARESAQSKYTELGLARQMFGDDQAALDYRKASLQQQYGEELKRIANTLDTGVQRDTALASASQIEQQGVMGKAAIMQQIEAQKLAQARAAAAARAKGPDWSRIPFDELSRAVLSGQAPGGAVEYYAKRMKELGENQRLDRELDSKNLADRKTEAEIAKLEAEAKAGPGGKMSDGDKKLARLAEGITPAVSYLAPYLSGDKSIPYLGVAETGPAKALDYALPEAFKPNENITFRNSVDAVANVLLRDESGAALPPAEVASKKASWGIGAGSESLRKEGLRRMLLEFRARKANGTLTDVPIDAQPIDAQPVADGR